MPSLKRTMWKRLLTVFGFAVDRAGGSVKDALLPVMDTLAETLWVTPKRFLCGCD